MERLIAAFAEPVTAAPLFFLMLDIDDFKKINDNFGHDVGDQVLIDVATVLQQHCHGHNFVRLGGEEFAVTARLTDVNAARQLALDIVGTVNSSRMHGHSLSISVGLANHESREAMSSLMRRADLALCYAKSQGKNRYAMAGRVALAV